MSISIYWKNQSRMKFGFPLPVTSNLFECISLKSWKDKLLLSHPPQQNTLWKQWRSDGFISEVPSMSTFCSIQNRLIGWLWTTDSWQVSLSTFCWHILRFCSCHDIGHTWEGRVLVAPGSLSISEENNQHGCLGKEYRQQGVCRAILLLPSSATTTQAWCFWIIVFISPSKPLLHDGSCTPLETICPLLPHPGALITPYIFQFKLFLASPYIFSSHFDYCWGLNWLSLGITQRLQHPYIKYS